MGADGRRLVVTAHPKPEDPLDRGYLSDLEHFFRPLGNAVVDWDADVDSADVAVVWDASATFPRGVRSVVADPLLTPGARDVVSRWVAGRVTASERVREGWELSFRGLKAFLADRRLILVGAGPLDGSVPNGAYAYLGSALLDTKRTAAMPPSFVIAADSVGQFGTGRAARAFQEQLREVLEEGAQLVVPEHLGPLAKTMFPRHADRVHVVPVGGQDDRLWTTGRTRELGNVLTTLGLPLAAALGCEWELLGVSTSDAASDRHWDAKADTLAALENMVLEPASVAVAASGSYRAKHYDMLAESLLEIRMADAPSRRDRSRHVARLVKAVDASEDFARPAAVGLAVVTVAVLAASAVGVLSVSTLALMVSVLAVLAMAVVGLLLRQRLNRWQLKFERERRAMERRERRLLLSKLEELEGRLGSKAD